MPKLNFAAQKVANLDREVKRKELERQTQEQLEILEGQIEKFKQTRGTLEERLINYKDLCELTKSEINFTKSDIEEVSKKLRDMNKKNLTDTYMLEDMQEEYEMLYE